MSTEIDAEYSSEFVACSVVLIVSVTIPRDSTLFSTPSVSQVDLNPSTLPLVNVKFDSILFIYYGVK